MPYWYEVFDNEEVQLLTRRQVGQLSGVAVATIVLTLSVLALAHAGAVSLAPAALVIVAAWLATVRWIASRLRRLRRVVWCVKISDRAIVGYDYTRQKTALDWTKVERVELAGRGLRVFGPPPCSFEIPHLFPDFAELSHRVLFYAEFYDVPVFIDGQPLQELDVYALYPFLAENASPGSPGSASGPAAA